VIGQARRRARTGSTRGPTAHARMLTVVLSIGLLIALVATSVGISLAIFTAQHDGTAVFGAKALFPGERVTPAFQVIDGSSGSEVDRSSSFAFAGDGLTTTTSAWSSSFAASRYLEFDLNASLAAGVALSSASFDFRVASGGAGQACFYFEVRRISTGAVVATQGSSGSPVGCVTGTTLSSFSTPIPSVGSTDLANDLRIRVFGSESAGGSMVVDLATVSGSTAYQTFTLYPVMYRDAADGTPQIVPWGLDIP
jgi:hypothetical protein